MATRDSCSRRSIAGLVLALNATVTLAFQAPPPALRIVVLEGEAAVNVV
jgi:hypothetical protein